MSRFNGAATAARDDLRCVMAKRNSQRATNDDGATPTAQPALPAPGRGPLAGYPVAAGATHARVHGVGDDGRIRDAMALGDGPDGPVTRIPVAMVGDAALWDALAPGARVRCVFSRYHGDVLKSRIGQGPIWVVPPRGETVDAREPAPAPAAAPASSNEHGLFLILRELQREARSEADARAARELAAMRELYSAQASLTRDYFAQMTSMFLSERRDERQSAARERADAARRDARLVAATRAAVREEIEEARDDEDDADDAPPPDAVASAISGLGEIVRPLATEIGRRAIGGVGS